MSIIHNKCMKKIILFISAFVPMYILLEINLIVEIANDNLPMNITNTVVIVVLGVFILIGSMGLLLSINCKDKNYEIVKVVSCNNITDKHFLGYFSLFVLIALTFDLSKFWYIAVFIVINMFIGIVYIRNNIYYINPMLNILGYSFYDITYEDMSGEKHELRIFHKGEINIGNNSYKLYNSDKNMHFLEIDE